MVTVGKKTSSILLGKCLGYWVWYLIFLLQLRKLQNELDVVKNVNKRLEVQLKSSKSRNFGKSAIKRQIGTQTIGLGCSSPQKCDMALIERMLNFYALGNLFTTGECLASKTLVIENEGLQKKVEQLLKEVEILNEQKAMSVSFVP